MYTHYTQIILSEMHICRNALVNPLYTNLDYQCTNGLVDPLYTSLYYQCTNTSVALYELKNKADKL